MDIGSLSGDVSLEDQFSSALDLVKEKVQGFVDSFEHEIGSAAITTVALTTAVLGLTAAVTALGNRGSDVADVAGTFEHFTEQAGGASDVLSRMRAGVKGTVDDFALMKNASTLLAGGVRLSAEEFGTMSQAAFVLQNRGLGGTKEMLDLVSEAMLTGRTRALSMKLGVVETKDALQDYADRLNVTKDQLTESQQAEAKRASILAMLSAAVDEAGTQELDFGEKLEASRAKLANWVDELAQAVAASPHVTRAMDSVLEALGSVSDGASTTQRIVSVIDGFADAIAEIAPAVIGLARPIGSVLGFLVDIRQVLEPIAVGFAAWGGFTVAAWGLEKAVSAGSVAFKALAGAEAVALSPLAAIGVAAGAIWAAFEVGHWQPVSDFFQDLGLRLQGFSAEERKAAIEQSHLTAEQISGAAAADKAAGSAKVLTAEERRQAEATERAAAAHQQFEESVGAVVTSVVKANNEVGVASEAFKRLTTSTDGYNSAQALTIEAQGVLVPLLDKIVASGRQLTPEQQRYYELTTASTLATRAYSEALLAADGVQLKDIESLRAMGLSQEQIAVRLHTTVDALQAYSNELEKTRALQEQAAEAEGRAWGFESEERQRQIETTFQKEVDALDKTSPYYEEQLGALKRIRQANLDMINSDWAEVQGNSFIELQSKLEAAEKTLSRMGGAFPRAAIEAQRAKVDELREAYRNFGDTALAAGDEAALGQRHAQAELEATKRKAYEAQLALGATFTYDISSQAGVQQYRQMNPGMELSWSDEQVTEFGRRGGTLQQLTQMGVLHYRPGGPGGYLFSGTVSPPPPPAYDDGSWGGSSTVNFQPGSIVLQNALIADAKHAEAFGSTIGTMVGRQMGLHGKRVLRQPSHGRGF